MATSNHSRREAAAQDAEPAMDSSSKWETLERMLGPLASLKLTVVLFAMAMFIVFAGTLAQIDKDIWEVVDHYFRMNLTSPEAAAKSAFARIDLQVFFPPSFFPSKPQVPGWFPFPKGWLIGLAMAVNLLAAHAVRFKVQAGGVRLGAGLGVLALGVLTTLLVILSGSNNEGFQSEALLQWQTLWMAFKIGLATMWGISAACFLLLPREQRSQRWLILGLNVLFSVGLAYLAYFDGGNLQDSSMRILWQLIKATFAGLVLLAGCIMVFKKRAGVVVLHGGVGLMMLSEVVVGLWAVEGQMQIQEGQTAHYVQDIRSVELAVVEPALDDDRVTVVPQSFLIPGSTVRDKALPFDVQVERFIQNTDLRNLKPGDDNPATEGAGLRSVPEALRAGAGTDTDSKIDLPSAYVKLIGKESTGNLGTYLVSLHLRPQPIQVEDKTYQLQLRFKRTYKPYTMTLKDVSKDDYVGTETARSYSSDVQLVDSRNNVDRGERIWMNNPLRYAGETFYQSSYFRDPQNGQEHTTLQVVTNAGWMIPYVSCMIVAVGMLYHFSLVLVRFLNRRLAMSAVLPAADAPPGSPPFPVVKSQAHKPKQPFEGRSQRRTSEPKPPSSPAGRYFTLAVVLLGAISLLYHAMPPRTKTGELDFYHFGQLPVAYDGRTKPVDTLARNSLMSVSHKQTFVEIHGDEKKTQPAIKWLLDVIANPKAAEKHQVFRIENAGLLTTMGLTKRKGLRYSIDEFRDRIGELEKQAQSASKAKTDQRTAYQRDVLQLANSLRHYLLLQHAFSTPQEPLTNEREEMDFLIKAPRIIADFAQMENVPLAVPPEKSNDQWQPLPTAAIREDVRAMARRRNVATAPELAQGLLKQIVADMEKATGQGLSDPMQQNVSNAVSMAIEQVLGKTQLGGEPNAAFQSWVALLRAYPRGDAEAFNAEVAKYQTLLAGSPASELSPRKIRFEAYFNHAAPFYWDMYLYGFAFVLSILAWLGWSKPLNQASFWLIGFALFCHFLSLLARIYISGRPPVTTLYSSAVFIGWAAVVMGMVLEYVFRLGVGNTIAGVAGGATLLISHFLAGDGDTFKVLVAVLDTNFWLATHVVCVTLGYATTFVAGLLGLLYVLRGVITPSLTPSLSKDFARMTYGTLCFAIFFSFVGTVLGGLWADDSWGRFWGWDPKENGALLIVLWNALVLHARWGGMVKDRGLAVLAIVGNIVTSWSWFGVNELGVGLHSYGFTEGTVLALWIFWSSQLAIIGLGCLPKQLWASWVRLGGPANS